MDVKRTWIVKEEHAEQVRKEAFEKRCSQSEVIRRALDRHFEERDGK